MIDHLGFSYWDLASKMPELEAAGATVTTPIRDVPGVFQLAYINDPWGVRLEIVQDPQHLGFNHVHLRSPDPEAAFDWYEEQFGGVRLNFKGRIPGILYPGNVWLMIQQGDAFPSSEGVIDHIGWRAPETAPTVAALEANGVELTSQPRPMTLPTGMIEYFYVAGPDGARGELVKRAADMR